VIGPLSGNFRVPLKRRTPGTEAVKKSYCLGQSRRWREPTGMGGLEKL
jgi:hypothetical protein